MVVEDQNVRNLVQSDIINSDMDKREYRIVIGIRSYWITKEELEKYLKERRKPGIELVALRNGGLFLPVQCQEIAHRSVIEDSEKIEEGRYQCDSGNWHAVGVECYCNSEMVELPDGTVRIQEKTDKQLPEPQKTSVRPVSYQLAGSVKSF
jgi:hypothetical protein